MSKDDVRTDFTKYLCPPSPTRRFDKYLFPNPWYIRYCTLEEFMLGMLTLGTPLEISLVGNFDTEGLGSRRDIDFVGLYCIRDDPTTQCLTLLDDRAVELKRGQALILDNKKVLHGRKGPVGQRLLLRFWIKKHG